MSKIIELLSQDIFWNKKMHMYCTPVIIYKLFPEKSNSC